MNLMHLKYAVEVAKTSSITKAAENLFMGQPNLSRAIHELEDNLGIEIFRRTSKGMIPTPQGEEFLGYARKILAQVDAVEELYRGERTKVQKFSISVPRASYISCAFTEFSKRLNPADSVEIFYKETNSMRAISNILNADYKLGIIRYQADYDGNFKEMLAEKGLEYELISEFKYVLAMSEKSPLAQLDEIHKADLEPYFQIAHADPYVPSLPTTELQKAELFEGVDKHIFVFERGSQLDLLAGMPQAFMRVSPMPQRILDRFGLVERRCADSEKTYRDVLIFKRGYCMTSLDKAFIDELMHFKRALY